MSSFREVASAVPVPGHEASGSRNAEEMRAVNMGTRPVRRHGDAAAFWLCVSAAAASIALRALYLTQSWRIDLSVPQAFVAGEKLMGIVARHIVAGARPMFYLSPAAYYHGAFEAYLSAVAFRLFGESTLVLRAVPALLTFLWVPLTGLLAARLYGKRAGYLAAAMMALPAQLVFEWGCMAWGGISRIAWLLFGVYLLLLLMERVTRVRLVAFGFLVGFSIWVCLLSLGTTPIYALGLFACVRLTRRQWGLLLIAGLIGLAPLIYGNVREPLASVRALGARVRWSLISRQRVPDEGGRGRFFRSIPLMQTLGVQPRYDGRWSATGTLVAAFLVGGSVAAAWRAYRRRHKDVATFCGAMLLAACVGMGVMSGLPGFFGEPVARYSIGLYPAACALAVGWLAQCWPRLAVSLVALFTMVNAVQLAKPIHAEARTPSHVVINALLAHGLDRGFGADNMYDLVFDSDERVIIQPVEWAFVPEYLDMVLAADRIFYLYRDDQEHKVSYQVFIEYLAKRGIQFSHFDVAEYHVLYDFEPPGSINAQAIKEMRAEIRQHKDRSRRRLS
jgi:hypothetical protein